MENLVKNEVKPTKAVVTKKEDKEVKETKGNLIAWKVDHISGKTRDDSYYRLKYVAFNKQGASLTISTNPNQSEIELANMMYDNVFAKISIGSSKKILLSTRFFLGKNETSGKYFASCLVDLGGGIKKFIKFNRSLNELITISIVKDKKFEMEFEEITEEDMLKLESDDTSLNQQ